MEQRVITQVKIYYLVMNPMTDRTEASKIVVMSEDRDRLIRYYTDNLVPYYNDGNWSKTFRKDTPLEWYNPLGSLEENKVNHWGHGLKSEWVDESAYFNEVKNKYFFV